MARPTKDTADRKRLIAKTKEGINDLLGCLKVESPSMKWDGWEWRCGVRYACRVVFKHALINQNPNRVYDFHQEGKLTREFFDLIDQGADGARQWRHKKAVQHDRRYGNT